MCRRMRHREFQHETRGAEGLRSFALAVIARLSDRGRVLLSPTF